MVVRAQSVSNRSGACDTARRPERVLPACCACMAPCPSLRAQHTPWAANNFVKAAALVTSSAWSLQHRGEDDRCYLVDSRNRCRRCTAGYFVKDGVCKQARGRDLKAWGDTFDAVCPCICMLECARCTACLLQQCTRRAAQLQRAPMPAVQCKGRDYDGGNMNCLDCSSSGHCSTCADGYGVNTTDPLRACVEVRPHCRAGC